MLASNDTECKSILKVVHQYTIVRNFYLRISQALKKSALVLEQQAP